MGRKFDIPIFYRSSLISSIKQRRREEDPRKHLLTPSTIDLGPIRFKLARHFGFCFGVENAIEIAYRALHENPNNRVFLLSEMIHNPHVNHDLISRGVRFILTPAGEQLIPFEELNPDDIVIVPAFGTTIDLCEKLDGLGIDLRRYDATCPFVEKVWKRSGLLGQQGFTVVIHGKHRHEETRATFSHAAAAAPAVIVRDREETKLLGRYIRREIAFERFFADFEGRHSDNFDPSLHLDRIGVVNQTTMLATETQEISELLRGAMIDYFGANDLPSHFADTRDTLCYATSENQNAVLGLVREGGDLAIVVGGYNSSNTSHLVELCEEHVPTFYIKDADEIIDQNNIRHLEWRSGEVKITSGWLPRKMNGTIDILLTAGASCPDALVDQVVTRVSALYGVEDKLNEVSQQFRGTSATSVLAVVHN